jgi:transcriptional repressor NrdR
MKCPYCGFEDTQVKDSRPTDDGASIRRRRVCPSCDGRFTTFERVQLKELMVIKNDGSKEPFERDKLLRSFRLPLQKRPVSEELIEQAINQIVRDLETSGEDEISSLMIGEKVMATLKTLDTVAYVRYASIYKDFREVSDYNAFIAELQETSKNFIKPQKAK